MSRNHVQIKNDPRWKRARAACLERDGWACVKCDTHQEDLADPLEADHIIELDVAPELAFELENLQTLCRPCHIEKGRATQTIVRNTWINPKYQTLTEIAALAF